MSLSLCFYINFLNIQDLNDLKRMHSSEYHLITDIGLRPSKVSAEPLSHHFHIIYVTSQPHSHKHSHTLTYKVILSVHYNEWSKDEQ